MADVKALAGDERGALRGGGGDNGVERKRRLVGGRALLSAGEDKEAIEQPVDVIELVAQPVAEVHHVRRGGPGLGQRDIEPDSHGGVRGAQLVRGVGDELALGLERPVQAAEQVVEGVGQLLELVVGAAEVEPFVQVGG